MEICSCIAYASWRVRKHILKCSLPPAPLEVTLAFSLSQSNPASLFPQCKTSLFSSIESWRGCEDWIIGKVRSLQPWSLMSGAMHAVCGRCRLWKNRWCNIFFHQIAAVSSLQGIWEARFIQGQVFLCATSPSALVPWCCALLTIWRLWSKRTWILLLLREESVLCEQLQQNYAKTCK